MDNSFLKAKALDIRESTIRTIGNFGSGHIGGAMSIIEMLTFLYYEEMNLSKKDDRDRFICSKGHAGPAVYAVLADKGYFPKEWLSTLNQGGTKLPSHCDMRKTPGVDFTAGSLGQGVSAAVGIALGQRLKNYTNSYTFVVIGDGESQEGEVWEAAESASSWKLNNLIAFTDRNGQQLDGYTKDIINMEGLEKRWEGFNWYVQTIDGHNFDELRNAIKKAKNQKEKPSMIIMNTIKSKGFIPGEKIVANHSMTFDLNVAEKAIEELERREKND